MEIKGKIKSIGQTSSFGTSNFKKREIVIETEEQYPQSILVTFTQDKCAILDNYSKGDNVAIGINLKGREWTNPQGEVKYFNEIAGWKINKENQQSEKPSEKTTESEPKNDDSLPF
jgi:single-stranded DNA-binding protein